MRQIYSNKKISIHSSFCTGMCPHKKVCYLRKRKKRRTSLILPFSLRRRWLDEKITIYESICYNIWRSNKNLLDNYENYNITTMSNMINPNECYKYKNNLLISIYNRSQAERLKDFKKSFLIKDSSSLRDYEQLLKTDTGQIYFPIDQSFLTKIILLDIIEKFDKYGRKEHSLDVCLRSYIVNGQCPYKNNYIDINFDGTIRKCPFNTQGYHPSNLSNINKLFKLELEPEKCKYKELFGGNDER